MSKPRLIVASARLPVTLSHRHDTWEVATSTGGLVTALKAVAERRPFTWLGWPGTSVGEPDRPEVTRVLAQHGSVPVFISKGDIEGFYMGFSNRELWPLFHNLTDRSHFGMSGYQSYEKVNEMFAEEICRLARPGDVIWVHDYQLALVPEMVRRRGTGCPIGFFLHIPFPSAETYRTLPVREQILRGMLGADLIGFHAYEYVSHFRNAALRVLGLESEPMAIRMSSRKVQLGVLPIGIDPAEIHEMAESREARQELASLQSTYAGKKIIVGVDRLDYTKGIPAKLLAFEQLLQDASEVAPAGGADPDCGAVAHRRGGVPAAQARRGRAGRPHQRPLRLVEHDAGRLRQPGHVARAPRWTVPGRRHRAGYACARRDEPGGAGIRRGARRARRHADPQRIRRSRALSARRTAGEPVQHRRGRGRPRREPGAGPARRRGVPAHACLRQREHVHGMGESLPRPAGSHRW